MRQYSRPRFSRCRPRYRDFRSIQWKARQHGVAVVAFRINRIAPVGVVAPWCRREIHNGSYPASFDVQRMYLMSAHHLLQANNIRANAAHGVAQFGQIKRRLNAVKPLWVLVSARSTKIRRWLSHNSPVNVTFLNKIV